MLQKLNALVETVDFLQQYPVWVKTLLSGWLLCGGVLLVLLVVYHPKPPPPKGVIVLKVVRLRNEGEGLLLDIHVKNFTDKPVDLLEVELTFYRDKRPDPTVGSLQAPLAIAGRYVVTHEAKSGKSVARLLGETTPLTADIQFPIPARKDYAVVSLMAPRQIPKEKGDRFLIAIEAAGMPPMEAGQVEVVMRYDDDKATAAKTFPLR